MGRALVLAMAVVAATTGTTIGSAQIQLYSGTTRTSFLQTSESLILYCSNSKYFPTCHSARTAKFTKWYHPFAFHPRNIIFTVQYCVFKSAISARKFNLRARTKPYLPPPTIAMTTPIKTACPLEHAKLLPNMMTELHQSP